MGSIEKLAHIDYLLVILGFFTILFAAKEIIEIFSYFKKKLRLKTGIDQDKETIENRIKTLEKHDNWQYQEILKISKGIDDIKDNLVQKEISDIRWELLNFVLLLQVDRIIIEKLLNIFFEPMSNMKTYLLIII